MKKFAVALTNDDGPRSPLIGPFREAINQAPWCRALNVVLPAEEQSWVADAITRFQSINVTPHNFGSVNGYLVRGTPADCASLALNNLQNNERPELLVSGINMGTNAGLAFFLSSGTVGAATHAFLNKVHSVAVSVSIPERVYRAWVTPGVEVPAEFGPDFDRIAKTAVRAIAALIDSDAWKHADLYTINLPWEVTDKTEISITKLKRTFYLPFFHAVDNNVYRHNFQGFQPHEPVTELPELQNDIDALEDGKISITPIRYAITPAVGAEFRSRLTANYLKLS